MLSVHRCRFWLFVTAFVCTHVAAQVPTIDGDFGLLTTPSVTISTAGSSFDTEIALFDLDGAVIDTNDDADPPSVRTSLIGPATLTPGVYYIAASGFNTLYTGSMPFGAEPQPLSDGGSLTIAASTPSDGTRSFAGVIQPGTPAFGGEVDFYRLQVAGITRTQSAGIVFADLHPLIISDEGSDFGTRFGLYALLPGSFVFEPAFGFFDTGEIIDIGTPSQPSGPGELEFAAIEGVFAVGIAGNDSEFGDGFTIVTQQASPSGTATVNIGGLSVSDTIRPGGDSSFVTFQASPALFTGQYIGDGRTVRIEAQRDPAGLRRTAVALWTAEGELLQTDDTGDATRSAFIERTLDPGVYVAAVATTGVIFRQRFSIEIPPPVLLDPGTTVDWTINERGGPLDLFGSGDAVFAVFEVVAPSGVQDIGPVTDGFLQLDTCTPENELLGLEVKVALYAEDGSIVQLGAFSRCSPTQINPFGIEGEFLSATPPVGRYFIAVAGSGAEFLPDFVVRRVPGTTFRSVVETSINGTVPPGFPPVFGDVRFYSLLYTCLADANLDGMLTPADFNAWVVAFNAQGPACDQNRDGFCNGADFNAWILNFNAGC
ncbi:MAG: PPC domain-containing protein [Planctomycetota bacterium]